MVKRKNELIVGRGATGIYLILVAEKMRGKKVLVPGNICYAAVYPIVFAEAIPVFCDTGEDGNITLNILEQCYKEEPFEAVVMPHMYGNPVRESAEIADFCSANNVLLIEDCASAMGAILSKTEVGSFGDYVIYSTGYAKLLDLGYGGIVSSDRDISKLKEVQLSLPVYSEEIEKEEQFFSKIYRTIRNAKSDKLAGAIWATFKDNVRDLFLYRLDEKKEAEVKKALGREAQEVLLHRNAKSLYDSLLLEKDEISRYEYDEGAVPWRYNLVVNDASLRRCIIDRLLEEQLPVSDWYPNVTEIFGDKQMLPCVDAMEQQVLNFPLTIEQAQIERICQIINGT